MKFMKHPLRTGHPMTEDPLFLPDQSQKLKAHLSGCHFEAVIGDKMVE